MLVRRFRLRGSAAFSLILILSCRIIPGIAGDEPRYVEGEAIVFSLGESRSLESILERFKGGLSIQPIKACGAYLVRSLPRTEARLRTSKLLAALRESGWDAEPNWILSATPTPVTSCAKPNWGLTTIEQDKVIPLPDASNVVVAVIDSGVDHSKLKLWSNLDEKENGIDDDNNGVDDDVNGANFLTTPFSNKFKDDENHGTSVAGIISEVTNWKAQIMPVKALDHNASGTDVSVAESVQYAIDKKAQIINLSLSVALDKDETCRCTRVAIEAAAKAGILIVAAAGSADFDADVNRRYPAAFPIDEIISVTATTSEDKLRHSSAWGKTSVDLGAPGDYIYTLFRNDGYGCLHGTSAAAPFVAGAAALLKAVCEDATALQIKEVILGEVDKVSGLKSVTGGRLNLRKAIESWQNKCPDVVPK